MAIDDDGTDVQDATDADLLACIEDFTRGVHDGFAKAPPRPPVADKGSTVIDDIGAAERQAQGLRIA